MSIPPLPKPVDLSSSADLCRATRLLSSFWVGRFRPLLLLQPILSLQRLIPLYLVHNDLPCRPGDPDGVGLVPRSPCSLLFPSLYLQRYGRFARGRTPALLRFQDLLDRPAPLAQEHVEYRF